MDVYKSISIPVALWNADIGLDAKYFYMFALQHSLNTGFAYFTNAYVMRQLRYNERKVQRIMVQLRDAKLVKSEIIDNTNRRIYPLYFGSYVPQVDITTLKMTDGTLVHDDLLQAKTNFPQGFSLPDWSKTVVVPTPPSNCGGQDECRTFDDLAPTDDCRTDYNTLPTVSFINTNSTVLPKLGIIPRSNINIITKDNNTNITAQNFDEQNLDAFTFLLTVVKDMQTTMEQMNDNIIFLNRRIIQNDTNTTEDGVVENAMDAVKPTPPVEITGKPLAKAKKDRGSGDGQTIEQQIKNMPKPKETKAVKMKRWNEENWYRLFADPEAGNTDAMRMMRIILVKYPEIMSITNYLKLEDADLLLKQYELEDISYALSYLNGFAGRNKYDNVLGAIQAVIANKKSWSKK